MEISNLIPHIESLIFASEKPLTSIEITDLINQAFGFMEDKIVADQVDAALEGIVEKYNSEFYPFEVRQSGGGWQFLTKKEFHKTVAQLNGEKFLKRLSSAALETLAIVAYKQPVTKGEIEAIRGVSSDYAVQKLLEKELIIISGRNEKLPGHPLVYSTSKNFMDYFGINSADDLPRIKEVLAEQIVEPTIVQSTELEQSENLLVTDHGELIELEVGEEPHVNGHSFGVKDTEEDSITDEEATSEGEFFIEASFEPDDLDDEENPEEENQESSETEQGEEEMNSEDEAYDAGSDADEQQEGPSEEEDPEEPRD